MELSEWTSLERELAEAMLAGDVLDVTTRTDQTVRAQVIRNLLLGRWPQDLRDDLPDNPDPQGLRLDGATITGRIDLDYLRTTTRLELVHASIPDGVTLNYAKIPDVYLVGTTLGPTDKVALDANQAIIELDLDLREITATSNEANSAVRLTGAHIGGQLQMNGAPLTNDTGPALIADKLSVDSNATTPSLTATGSGKYGALRLTGAHIGGQLQMNGTHLTNDTGPALIADALIVDSDADLSLTATGSGELGAVRLNNAHVGGLIHGDFASVTSSSVRLAVDGLAYRGIPTAGVPAWLELLEKATPVYAAQPYRHLAAASSAAGHDDDTRDILIAQRRDQLTRASTGRRDRFWGRLTRWTLGYGYQPWRALVWLIGVTVVSAALTALISTHGLYPKDQADQRCSVIERALIGIDNALPLVTTTLSSTCLTRPTTNRSAQAVTAIGIGAQIAGWAFATLLHRGLHRCGPQNLTLQGQASSSTYSTLIEMTVR